MKVSQIQGWLTGELFGFGFVVGYEELEVEQFRHRQMPFTGSHLIVTLVLWFGERRSVAGHGVLVGCLFSWERKIGE